MGITRRDQLKLTAAALLPAVCRGASTMNVRFGAMQGCLPQGSPEQMFEAARRVGLAGVELNIGRDDSGGKMPLADPERQRAFMDAARSNQQVIAGVVLDIFHKYQLKDDPTAARFIDDGILIAQQMQARVLLLPFFGKSALTNRDEMGRVADHVKRYTANAQKAGILLGLEDTISAEDNAWMLDRIGSDAVKVYYDVGNSTNIGGFDAPKEIRWLGGKRICQIHIKDRGYLGDGGKVDVKECLQAIRDSGYEGFLNFETSAPSGDRESDLRRNFEYTKKLLAQVQAA